jgi:hypothetical protein
MTTSPTAPEFTRPVPVEDLPHVAGSPLTGEATEVERAALAARFRVPAVRSLRYAATVAPWGPGGWRVQGVAEAGLTQTCVVTLEPVDTAVREPFDRRFVPGRRLAEAATLDPDADEAPEPLGAAVDPAEIAAEAVALGIDPYPRAPEARFDGAAGAPPGAEPLTDEAARPFARLAALRGSKGREGGGEDPG